MTPSQVKPHCIINQLLQHEKHNKKWICCTPKYNYKELQKVSTFFCKANLGSHHYSLWLLVPASWETGSGLCNLRRPCIRLICSVCLVQLELRWRHIEVGSSGGSRSLTGNYMNYTFRSNSYLCKVYLRVKILQSLSRRMVIFKTEFLKFKFGIYFYKKRIVINKFIIVIANIYELSRNINHIYVWKTLIYYLLCPHLINLIEST